MQIVLLTDKLLPNLNEMIFLDTSYNKFYKQLLNTHKETLERIEKIYQSLCEVHQASAKSFQK